MSESSCFSCVAASFKVYHFDNFTFARSREQFTPRNNSFSAKSLASLRRKIFRPWLARKTSTFGSVGTSNQSRDAGFEDYYLQDSHLTSSYETALANSSSNKINCGSKKSKKSRHGHSSVYICNDLSNSQSLMLALLSTRTSVNLTRNCHHIVSLTM